MPHGGTRSRLLNTTTRSHTRGAPVGVARDRAVRSCRHFCNAPITKKRERELAYDFHTPESRIPGSKRKRHGYSDESGKYHSGRRRTNSERIPKKVHEPNKIRDADDRLDVQARPITVAMGHLV